LSQRILHVNLQLESPPLRRLRNLEKSISDLAGRVNLTEFPMVRRDSPGPKVSSHREFNYLKLLDRINAELPPEKRFDELMRLAPELVELMRGWFSEVKYMSNAKGTFELLRHEFKLVATKLRCFEASLTDITPLHRAVYAHFLAAIRVGPDRAVSDKYAAQHPDVETVYPDEFYMPLTDARDQCFRRGALQDFENYLGVFEERFSTDLAVFALASGTGGYRARTQDSRTAALRRLTDELEASVLLEAAGLPTA